MGWRERLQQGSFKGVEFQTRASNVTKSRNVVSHSYLLTEDISSLDLGRKPDKFSMDIFFIGDDYMEQRDRFIEVCSNPEPGNLVHPYLGSLNVLVESYTINETAEDGRMASLSIGFVEAGRSKFPDISEDRTFKLNAAVTQVNTVATSNFQRDVFLNNVPDFVRAGVTDRTNLVFTAMRSVIDNGAFVATTASDILSTTSFINNNASLFANILRIINPVPTLISSAGNFSNLIQQTLGLIYEVGTDGKAAQKVFKEGRETGITLETETTDLIKKKNTNQKTADRFITVSSIAYEGKSIQNMTFESRSEAVSIRDDIVNRIDTLLESSTEDSEFQALKTLKSEVIKFLPPENLNLPNVKTVNLSDTLPALVASYQIYGNIDKEADIISRNNIRHPGFIDPNKQLEVLVDE